MLDLITNFLAFVVALGVIISVHEFGHLVVAKIFSMKVPVYSIGFGRALWKRSWGGTEYRLAWIPLGGYVRLAGDDPEEVSDDPTDFLNKPRWQRILVYLAGPAANAVLALVLMAGVFMAGIAVPVLPDLAPVVGQVDPSGPAAGAGLVAGDRIVAIEGEPVSRWEEVRFALMTSAEKPVDLTVARGGDRLQVTVTPRKVSEYGVGDAGVFPRVRPRITQVMEGSPAEASGLRAGDILQTLNGRPVYDLREFVAAIEGHAGESIRLEIERDGEPVEISVVPTTKDGVGQIGVYLGYLQRYGPLEAVVASARYNWQIVRQTVAVIGKIFTGRMAAKSALSGPIEIAALSGEAARSGLASLVHLIALVSISIGLLNLFPIPILDGGQILLLLIESVIRRDLPLTLRERFQQVGFVLILALMAMVIYFDLVKNLPQGWLPGG